MGCPLTTTPTCPQEVTFNAGETEKSFTFAATQDDIDDDGESVKLGFDSPLPAGVTAQAAVAETTVVTLRTTTPQG